MKNEIKPLENINEVPKKPNLKRPIIWGLWVIGIFVGFFALWSILFPIETAAIARGNIVVSGNVKTIQHLEGGIIKSINVDDGDYVKKGQLLLELDPTQAQARENSSYYQYLALLAKEARLLSEKDNLKEIKFPKELIDHKNDKKVMDNISGQMAIFNDNQEAYEKLIASLDEKIAHLNIQIQDLTAQVQAETERFNYIDKEIKAAEKLLPKKYIGPTDIWRLNRDAAAVKSQVNEHKAEIAQAKQQISQTTLQKIAERNRIRREILAELRETQIEISNVYEIYRSSKDIVVRSKILAPINGIVVNLKYHTIGGVIKAGEPILEIVPQEKDLVIEAKISPLDIDVVHQGMLARVKLTAYLSRHTPTLSGEVTQVSADALKEDATDQTYYNIKVKIDKNELKKLSQVKLHPGMPAEVMVIIDKKNFLEYLLTPLTSSFNRAFRAQ